MKSILLKLLPVVIAVLLIAFKTPEKRTLYYWFYYNNGFPIPLNAFEWASSNSPYACEDEGDYICDRAYLPADTELFFDGFSLKRRPKYGTVFQVQTLKEAP
jgi:hypothetical protein